ncbi:MAG: hypothetical protein JWM37_900 [Candidatus Saccharibacteria bacterium]|nr:hypothetical protein [Candidatus Saccharibacteria bacterium]
MEPIRGHESADDDRPKRPNIKAPIPFETGSDKKSKKKSKPEKKAEVAPAAQELKKDKPAKPEKAGTEHLVFEEGTLFQREPDEDKLRPAPKPAEKEVEPAVEPDQTNFQAEVDRQAALEIAEQEAAKLAQAKPETPVEAAVIEAEKELLTEIQAKVAEAKPEKAEEAIDTAYQEMIDSINKESLPQTEPTSVEVPEPAAPAAPETDQVTAARQAAEAAYRDSIETPILPLATPDVRTDLPPQPPAEIAPPTATEPAERRFFGFGSFLAGDWLGYRRGRREGEQARDSQVASSKRGAKQSVAHLQEVIRRREAQIAELEREHYIDELAISTTTVKVNETAPQQYRQPGQEIMTMPLPVNPFAGRAEAMPPVPIIPLGEVAPVRSQAETTLAPIPEQAPVPAARNEQLSTTELVQIAERIYVDGVTVKSMFEVGRFDEDSLRLIVDTYLRSGNVNQVVSQEVQRHDHLRFKRFETLNQVPAPGATAYGPPVPLMPPQQPSAHGSLPVPQQSGQPVIAAGNAVNPNQPGTPVKPEESGSNLERIVLIVSIILVVVASVILIGLFARS